MITLIYHSILHYYAKGCNSHIAQRCNFRFVHNNHRKLHVVSAAKRHPQFPFCPRFSAIFSSRFACLRLREGAEALPYGIVFCLLVGGGAD